MMRATLRASLLVAFYLLTSAATAYAECAWVLWTKVAPLVQDQRIGASFTQARAARTVSSRLKEQPED